MALSLQERDQTLTPAVCYDICNNAYIVAETIGKTPALCQAGSEFEFYYNKCDRCIEANIDTVKEKNATVVYLDPKFAQFIDYCQLQGVDPSTVTSFASPTAPLPSTNSDGVYLKTIYGTTTLSDGQVISLPVIDTITPLVRGDFQASTTTSSPTTSPSSTSSSLTSSIPPPPLTPVSGSESPPSTPTATIAGATVGGVVGLIAILGVIIFYMRRNMKMNKQNIESQSHEIDGQQRAQLHGDSIEPKELSTQANTAEMEGYYGIYYEDPSKPGYLVPPQAAQAYPAELYGSGIEQLAPQLNTVAPLVTNTGKE